MPLDVFMPGTDDSRYSTLICQPMVEKLKDLAMVSMSVQDSLRPNWEIFWRVVLGG